MRHLWNTLRELFGVLPRGAGAFYARYSIVTCLLALLDAAALALVAAILTPLASGSPAKLPLIGEVDSAMTPWLILLICALFISKGVFAITLHWRATRRFQRYELEIGSRLFRSYTHTNWESRSQLSTAELTRIVDLSMANANLSFILPLSQIPGNLLTFVTVLLVLVVAQPLTALIAFVYLTLIALFMIFVITKKSRLAGKHNRQYGYRVATIMTEMVDALKEVTLRGKLDEVGEVVRDYRVIATRARANISFLGITPKYVFEAALIGGFLLVGGSAYLLSGPAAAVVALGLFAATGSRMIPAINAVQSSLATASAGEVYAKDVIRELTRAEQQDGTEAQVQPDTSTLPEQPRMLRFKDVSYRYPGAEHDVIESLNLEVPFGSRLAVVGPSGAGKSTFVDLLLGLSHPTGGAIEIDGVPLDAVINQWRSHVGYVPQKVALFDASIAQNVALTWTDDYDEGRVAEAMRRAQLGELLDRTEGVRATIGERGSSISGGQQQRLGIARALYADPLVMVLDEATSALDTATENRVTESMRGLAGEVTFVTIAHRLATIRDYDTVCYLDSGRVLGQGTFDEVVEQVPAFAHQAQLAGLA